MATLCINIHIERIIAINWFDINQSLETISTFLIRRILFLCAFQQYLLAIIRTATGLFHKKQKNKNESPPCLRTFDIFTGQ